MGAARPSGDARSTSRKAHFAADVQLCAAGGCWQVARRTSISRQSCWHDQERTPCHLRTRSSSKVTTSLLSSSTSSGNGTKCTFSAASDRLVWFGVTAHTPSASLERKKPTLDPDPKLDFLTYPTLQPACSLYALIRRGPPRIARRRHSAARARSPRAAPDRAGAWGALEGRPTARAAPRAPQRPHWAEHGKRPNVPTSPFFFAQDRLYSVSRC